MVAPWNADTCTPHTVSCNATPTALSASFARINAAPTMGSTISGRAEEQTPFAAHVQGDFWDARTSVPHTTLNAVRAALSTWRHPTIALTGNHDQSNAAGTEHGMRILEDICPDWTVISEPVVAGGALWLPYRCARRRWCSYGCKVPWHPQRVLASTKFWRCDAMQSVPARLCLLNLVVSFA